MRRQAGLLAEIPVAQASPLKRASPTNWAGSHTLYKQAIFSGKMVWERGYNVGCLSNFNYYENLMVKTRLLFCDVAAACAQMQTIPLFNPNSEDLNRERKF